MPLFKRPSWWLWLCTVLLVGGALFHTFFGYSDAIHRSLHAWGSDDAYISYRYALNFAQGRGLTFNPETNVFPTSDRVEGYSNLLYVLIMAVAVPIVGQAGVYGFSVWFNILCAVASLFVFHELIKQRLTPKWRGLALLLFALTPSLWLWASSGMEVALVYLIQLGTVLFVNRVKTDQKRATLGVSVCVAVSILVRADGFLIPLLVVVYLMITRHFRSSALILLSILLTLGALTLWRLGYYGDVLPNTFYVKVAGNLLYRVTYGLLLLGQIVVHQGLWVYLIGLATVAIRFLARAVSTRLKEISLSFEVMFGLAWLGYWIYIGGDVYYDRFLMPLFALGIVILFGRLDEMIPDLQKRGLVLIAAGLVIVQLLTLGIDSRFFYTTKKYDAWLVLGNFLRQNYWGKTLAVDAAGKIPYISGLNALDMLGLNDRYIGKQTPRADMIGHMKFDSAYVFAQSPNLISAWIKPTLDMDYGLDRAAYLTAGYRIHYLLYSGDFAVDAPIIDVSELAPEALQKLIEQGYIYAVLEKVSP